MKEMTILERIMTMLEKHLIKITTAIKYFSVLCMGAGIALIIEFGFNFYFIGLIVLTTIVFYLANKIQKNKEEENIED